MVKENFEKGEIAGVRLVPKGRFMDHRGGVFHMLKKTDPEFESFGEIYFSQVNAGIVKGWTRHQKMTLNYLVVQGAITLVLWDDRAGSPTRQRCQEIYLAHDGGTLAVIPAGLWYAFRGEGQSPALIANCASIPHDPAEMERRPVEEPPFPYRWN